MVAYRQVSYPRTLEGLCDRVLTRLNDDDPACAGERWSKPLIRSLLGDVLAVVGQLMPDVLAEKREIMLKAGEHCQSLDEECTPPARFLSITDCETGRTMPIMMVPYEQIQRSNMYPVAPCRGLEKAGLYGSVTQFHVGVTSPSSSDFLVTPTPPAGSQLKLTVSCSQIDSILAADDGEPLPSSLSAYLPAVVELTLYMALSMDRDDPTLLTAAASHLQAFTLLTQMAGARVANTVAAVQGAANAGP